MSIFKQPLIQNPPPNLPRKVSQYDASNYTGNANNHEVDYGDEDDDDDDNEIDGDD